jgi:signal peptidase II
VANKKYYLILALSFIAFTIDRLTKYLFINQPDNSFVVFPKILIFELCKNKGMAFGFIENDILYYVLFSVISLILFYLLVDNVRKNNYYLFCCLVFIIIGAVSNLLDRIKYGGVVDFINVPFWSVFNLADIYIVIAVILWTIILFKHEKFSKNH